MSAAQENGLATPFGRVIRVAALVLGLAAGLVVFTPWDKLWVMAVNNVDERLPLVGLSWDGVRKEGPSGFQLRGLRITVNGMPGELTFEHADVRIGLNPLARIRLDTGGAQCMLQLYDNGRIEFQGDLNATYLLGRGDIQGVVHASGSLYFPQGATLPVKSWLDVRSSWLSLPGPKVYQDLAFTAEIEGAEVRIRDYSLSAPVNIKTSGTATLDPQGLIKSVVALKGEQRLGNSAYPYEFHGTVGQALR